MIRVLFIDDDPQAQKTLDMVLADGYRVCPALTAAQGLELLRAESPDVVLLDIDLPDRSGLDLLDDIVAEPGGVPVVMLTAYGDLPLVKRAIRAGAYDYMLKPYALGELEGTLRRAVQAACLRRRLPPAADPGALEELVGGSRKMRELRQTILRYAPADAPVLIQGESGSGKELAARALHRASPRREQPFLALSCAAVPESVLETELFGSEKGAFTDAVSRPGFFERACGGTLFLDEIGEMPLSAQAKLLRVLEAKELHRLGGREPVALNVRVVSATNRVLKDEVRAGRFREDLYYRLDVLPLTLPPLRERLEDLPLLVAWLLREHPRRAVEQPALEKLAAHSWPGNVRELRNVLERAAVLADGEVITSRDVVL
jgi:DNA-binding NtrC family response regulator